VGGEVGTNLQIGFDDMGFDGANVNGNLYL